MANPRILNQELILFVFLITSYHITSPDLSMAQPHKVTFRVVPGVPIVSLSAAESCLSDVSSVLLLGLFPKCQLRHIVSFFYAADKITEAVFVIFILYTSERNPCGKE